MLCSSRNVLWTARFHHPFHLHVGELVMTGMLVELMTFIMTRHQEHTHTQTQLTTDNSFTHIVSRIYVYTNQVPSHLLTLPFSFSITHTCTHSDSEPQQIFDVTDPFWLSGELGILFDTCTLISNKYVLRSDSRVPICSQWNTVLIVKKRTGRGDGAMA